MAKYDITGINFMTSGDKRGVISLTLQSNDTAGKKVYLLDKTYEDGKEISADEGTGIITESGKYDYLRTNYISNYKTTNTQTPLACKSSNQMLVLNERQTVISVGSLSGSTNYNSETTEADISANPPYVIQLNIDDGEVENYDISDVAEYNSSQYNIRKDFVFETNFDSEGKNGVQISGQNIYPMYDIMDMMMKSKAQKMYSNSTVPKNVGQTKTESTYNYTQDIYWQFDDYPVQYCQYRDSDDAYSFILTQPTTKAPYYLYTDLGEGNKSSIQYCYQLSSDKLKTNLCKYPSEYGYKTYKEYLNMIGYKNINQMTMLSLFSSYHNIAGIRYNYLVGMSENGKNESDSVLDYDDGNMPFGDMIITKNSYNSLYSVNMQSSTLLNNCRKYCGVLQSAKKMALKYYDYDKYTIGTGQSDGKGSYSHNATYGNMSTTGKYPYQKVEYLYKTNTSKVIQHKSNLFSIKIKGSGITEDEDTDASTKSFVSKIRNDIKNNIREFVDNICPANTQLFDTFFLN